MADTYTLHIAGLTRELPICKVNDHLDIAAFIMFSDVELTEACAAALLKKAPEFDVILTAEAKGIPLAYEMARQRPHRAEHCKTERAKPAKPRYGTKYQRKSSAAAGYT